jgi:hypothetical protein
MAGQTLLKGVFCARNKMLKDPGEHLSCPYCFGRKREVIERGERTEFCDFDPTKDPVSFGFPQGTLRDLRG